MLRTTINLLGAALLASLNASACAADPMLQARPAAVPLTLKTGFSQLTPKSHVYIPKDIAGAAPLLILLHGAGQQADPMLETFRHQADERGLVLLALKSEADTWTLKPAGDGADFGSDPANLDAALRELFAKVPIDPERTAILGFSDGASYALSIGLANPQLFRGVIALSPGTVWLSSQADPKQKLLIAHGKQDEVLPITNVRDRIVPGLEKAGLKPQVRWFRGGHEMDRKAVEDGLDLVFGPKR